MYSKRAKVGYIGRLWKGAKVGYHRLDLTLCDWICMGKWQCIENLSDNCVVVCPNYCLLKRTLYCQNPGFGTLRFGALIIFWIFRCFKYIFLSSRYIDSGHFCGNLCCRPKAGCIPKYRDLWPIWRGDPLGIPKICGLKTHKIFAPSARSQIWRITKGVPFYFRIFWY